MKLLKLLILLDSGSVGSILGVKSPLTASKIHPGAEDPCSRAVLSSNCCKASA